MTNMPKSIQKRVDALRKKLTKAIAIAAENDSVTLAEMGLNHTHVQHITWGGMIELVPGQYCNSNKARKYAATRDLAGLQEILESFFEHYTQKAMEAYQRDRERNVCHEPAKQDGEQETPGFRRVNLQDTRRWPASETSQSKRGASSLGGNSFEYHGD